MAESIQPATDDIVFVRTHKVACDGPVFSKHPRVYLTLDDNTPQEVVCPYCGRIYRFDAELSA